MCGANGATHHLTVLALQLRQLVHANHEGRDAGVVGEHLDVLRHLLDEFVERLQLVLRSLLVCCDVITTSRTTKVPELLQEAMTAVDTVGVPGLRLLHRTEEHLIQTQRVGAVAFNNHIGIHHVEHRLRHLLDSPAADILAILEHELCIVVFRTPSLEGLEVENVGRDNVHVDVDGCELIVGSTGLGSFLHHVQAEEHRMTSLLAGLVIAIDEVRTTLYHTLIDEFLERLFHVAHTEVEEELVPEA